MLEETLPKIKWLAWSKSWTGGRLFGISSSDSECLLRTKWRFGEIRALEVWTSSEHNCLFLFFNNFVKPLELINLLGFLVTTFNSNYFPSQENFMKSFWKLKAIVPNDCNHWTPQTTSTPPIGVEIIGLFNTYFPVVRLILWHFHEQFIVPSSAIITWNYGVVYTNKLRSLATVQRINLWVLPESINIVTFLFLIYPSFLRF